MYPGKLDRNIFRTWVTIVCICINTSEKLIIGINILRRPLPHTHIVTYTRLVVIVSLWANIYLQRDCEQGAKEPEHLKIIVALSWHYLKQDVFVEMKIPVG